MNESTTYNFGEHPICPHCEKLLDDCPVEDYIIKDSFTIIFDRCGWCNKKYIIENIKGEKVIFSK